MLLNPIEPVIQEIARVLKPGGIFVAMISGIKHPPLFDETIKILKSLVTEKHPHLKNFGWGDKRTWTRKGLQSLFPPSIGFAFDLKIDSYELLVHGSPAVLAKRLVSFFYSSELLDDEGKATLISRWQNLFAEQAPGKIAFSFPLTRFSVSKSGVVGDL